MKRIKEIIKKLKEWWKIPRYRGLMKLAFWFLFFLILFLIVFLSGHIKQSIKEIEQEEQNDLNQTNEILEITGYIYNYQINDGINNINISGTYYQGIDLFNFNNLRYYFKDGNYYRVDTKEAVSFEYPMREYQYNSIKELIKDRQYESKTEYKDGKIEFVYIIDKDTYNNFYQLDYQTEGNIIIKVTMNNNIFSSVVIDYSKYYVDKENYQVIINYSNVNNINGLDINIE